MLEFVTPNAAPYNLIPGAAAVIRQTVLIRSTEALPDDIDAVTVQVFDGATAVGSAITAAIDGAGPAYIATIPDTTTSGEAPATASWSAVWSYTIDGVVYQFRRLIRLVRIVVSPTVTSTELSTEYPDLIASLRATAAILRTDLAEAWEDLDRDLWEHGVDLHKVYDPRALARLHMTKAAHIRYAKSGATTRDELMLERAGELADEYKELLTRPALYDADSDGAADGMQRGTQAMPFDYEQRRYG